MTAISIADSLLTAPLIAFVASMLLTLARFDVRLPESLYPILSTFLLLAIGIKGGRSLAESELADLWGPLLAALVLGVVTPLVAFVAMRSVGRFSTVDSAALAAHYGSVSAVTFTVVLATLDARGIEFEGFMAGLLAVLEVIGIVVALFLARSSDGGGHWRSALTEVVRGRSIALLVLGLVIGAVVGSERLTPTDPLFKGLFPGVLALFLIELGATAAERLRDVRNDGLRLALLGVAVPLANGAIGAVGGRVAGLSTGGVAVMATLAASASYIAAPAAVRIALPRANPSLYITASLGITFPFNLTIGIPLYIALAQAIT